MDIKKILPGCAGLFTFCVFAVSGEYLVLLFPGLSSSLWLGLIALGAALESAYFATYLLSARTPVMGVIIELLIWLLPLYFLAGGFTYNLLWSGLFVLATWLVARGYGSQISNMEKVADYLGDQAASTVNWEYESLESKSYGRLSVKYFWSRLWFFGVLVSILAIVVHNKNIDFSSWVRLRLAVFGWCAVASGLFLQGGVYLFRLQILWSHARAQVAPNLNTLWLRNLGVFLILTLLLLSLAPINYSPVTAQHVGQALTGLFNRITEIPVLSVEHPKGIVSSSPEELNLSYKERGAPNWMGVLLAIFFLMLVVLFGGLLLALVGFLIVFFVQSEIERLRGFPLLAVQVYQALRKTFYELIRGIRGIRTGFLVSKKDLSQLGNLAGNLEYAKINQIRERRLKGVRGAFCEIIRVGNQAGLVFTPAKTPSEYAGVLLDYLPSQEQETVENFFVGYHLVRYGAGKLNKTEERILMDLGARIVRQIRSLEKGV